MLSIYPVNALKQNKRLIIQQGVFLAPGHISKSFIYNLAEITKNAKERKNHLYCFLLPNTKDFLKDTISYYYRKPLYRHDKYSFVFYLLPV